MTYPLELDRQIYRQTTLPAGCLRGSDSQGAAAQTTHPHTERTVVTRRTTLHPSAFLSLAANTEATYIR